MGFILLFDLGVYMFCCLLGVLALDLRFCLGWDLVMGWWDVFGFCLNGIVILCVFRGGFAGFCFV